MIWAENIDGVIGKDGKIPWNLPEDLAHFAEVTKGSTVVMGRRTWDSLPESRRPLPGRTNIVVTRNPDWSAEGALVANRICDAVDMAEGNVWIIGGEQIYRAGMHLADKLVITLVGDFDSVDGDAYAPRVDAKQWRHSGYSGWKTSVSGLNYGVTEFDRIHTVD